MVPNAFVMMGTSSLKSALILRMSLVDIADTVSLESSSGKALATQLAQTISDAPIAQFVAKTSTRPALARSRVILSARPAASAQQASVSQLACAGQILTAT
jgi:hypothetical protein